MHIILPYNLRSGIRTASPGAAARDDHDSFYRGLLILTLILFRFFPFWKAIFSRDIRIENTAADIRKKVAQIPILIRIKASGKIRPDRLQALSVIFYICSYVLEHSDRPLAFDVSLEKQYLYGQNPIPMYNIPSRRTDCNRRIRISAVRTAHDCSDTPSGGSSEGAGSVSHRPRKRQKRQSAGSSSFGNRSERMPPG